MSNVAPRERRLSIGPTVYHEEDDTNVKKPPRVFYEEVARKDPRRSSSVHSQRPQTHETGRYVADASNLHSPDLSATKPAFVETVLEKHYDEKPQYVERPFSADHDRPYPEVPYYYRTRSTPAPKYVPPRDENPAENPKLMWPKIRKALRDPFSEFFGTFMLVLLGEGSIAQVVLSNGTKGDYQSICWGWGVGVLIGVYVAGASGSNINPAVTLTNCILRKMPWQKLPIYAAAQTMGAFAAAGVVYGNYKSAIEVFEGGSVRTVPGYSETATAGIFANYPQKFMTKTGEFFSEFIASAILMFTVYTLQDTQNRGAEKLIPLVLFFVLFGIGACFGWETGFAINPARDFGPRLFTYFLGYGNEVWTAAGHYFWVPLIAPLFGCVFGGWLYDIFLKIGPSPVNTPWMGFKNLVRPNSKNDLPV